MYIPFYHAAAGIQLYQCHGPGSGTLGDFPNENGILFKTEIYSFYMSIKLDGIESLGNAEKFPFVFLLCTCQKFTWSLGYVCLLFNINIFSIETLGWLQVGCSQKSTSNTLK